MSEKLRELYKIGLLYELLDKCQEMVQSENLTGGTTGVVNKQISLIKICIEDEMEKIKISIPK